MHLRILKLVLKVYFGVFVFFILTRVIPECFSRIQELNLTRTIADFVPFSPPTFDSPSDTEKLEAPDVKLLESTKPNKEGSGQLKIGQILARNAKDNAEDGLKLDLEPFKKFIISLVDAFRSNKEWWLRFEDNNSKIDELRKTVEEQGKEIKNIKKKLEEQDEEIVKLKAEKKDKQTASKVIIFNF